MWNSFSQKSALLSRNDADLVAAVVEDERAPVLVLALPRIRMLVERRAVEARQAVLILRKVSRHPVEDHADAGLVERIDEELEILRRAEAARRREEADHLVAPRSGEGMLHHRQQLDVREAHVLHVRHQPLGHLAIRVQRARRAIAASCRDALRRPTSAALPVIALASAPTSSPRPATRSRRCSTRSTPCAAASRNSARSGSAFSTVWPSAPNTSNL